MRSLRRRWWWVAAAVVVAVVAGAVAWKVAIRESAKPVSVSDALLRFRRQAAERAARLPAAIRDHAPQPGTYVYATRGGEQSQLLGTRRHVYPARTTITVTAAGCGVVEQWDALQTRSETYDVCPSAGRWRFRQMGDVHSFFGHADHRTYRCTAGSAFLPASRSRGATWTNRCAISGTARADSGRVAGRATVVVAGRPVSTTRLDVRTQITGDTRGVTKTRLWVLPATGLIVRRTVDADNKTDTPIGPVHYRERYAMTLVSLDPRR